MQPIFHNRFLENYVRIFKMNYLFFPLLEMSSDSENDTAEDEEVNAEEEIGESTIFGLIDVLCILLSNNKSKMKTPQNLVYWKNIQHRFTKSCSLFFRYFRVLNDLQMYN